MGVPQRRQRTCRRHQAADICWAELQQSAHSASQVRLQLGPLSWRRARPRRARYEPRAGLAVLGKQHGAALGHPHPASAPQLIGSEQRLDAGKLQARAFQRAQLGRQRGAHRGLFQHLRCACCGPHSVVRLALQVSTHSVAVEQERSQRPLAAAAAAGWRSLRVLPSWLQLERRCRLALPQLLLVLELLALLLLPVLTLLAPLLPLRLLLPP